MGPQGHFWLRFGFDERRIVFGVESTRSSVDACLPDTVLYERELIRRKTFAERQTALQSLRLFLGAEWLDQKFKGIEANRIRTKGGRVPVPDPHALAIRFFNLAGC